jgi:hypothetical protein
MASSEGGMNILFDKRKGWLIRTPNGFVPSSEHKAFITLIVDGFDAHDARTFMRWIRSLAFQQFRDVAFVADARQRKYFVHLDGVGRRMNREVARYALRSDGASTPTADLMLRVARKYDHIFLADLQPIETSEAA